MLYNGFHGEGMSRTATAEEANMGISPQDRNECNLRSVADSINNDDLSDVELEDAMDDLDSLMYENELMYDWD